jgi:pimeloyl-ACP methyl ester carboxylesterase
MKNHTITNSGVRLHVTTYGHSEAPAVILMHGFPDNGDCWRQVAARLAPDCYVIVPDGRGIHRSDAPSDSSAYTLQHLVADVLAIADQLVPHRTFTLVGHDWGGVVAWATVSMHPQRIERALLCNAPHPAVFLDALNHDEAQRHASRYISALRSEGFEERFAHNDYEIPLGAFASVPLTTRQKDELRASWARPGRSRGALNWYRAASFALPGGTCDVPLPDGSVPVDLLWGEQDGALLVSLAERHTDAMPWLSLHVLPDANHWLPWTHPNVIAQYLLSK